MMDIAAQLIGCSPAIREIGKEILCASRSDAKVLITGESGVGKEVVARLNAEVAKVMANPDMKSFMQSQGAEAVSSTPEQLAALHKREYDKWGGVVKAAGITPE